jgi:hypothetical protein
MELPDLEGSPAPIEAREMARWAEEQAGETGDAQKTLDWMAREGEGEKLEAIAAEEKVPAARVRQRVSRMRRWMKERWAAELAAVAVLTLLALAAWWLLKKQIEPPVTHDEPPPAITPEAPSPLERARLLRADALRACDDGAWRACLDGLDEARGLDPEGDRAPAIGDARARAQDALATPPAPSSAPSGRPPPPEVKDVPDTKSAPLPAPKPTPTSAPITKPVPSVPSDEGLEKSKPVLTPGTGTGTGGIKPSGKMSPKKAIEKVLDRPGYGS